MIRRVVTVACVTALAVTAAACSETVVSIAPGPSTTTTTTLVPSSSVPPSTTPTSEATTTTSTSTTTTSTTSTTTLPPKPTTLCKQVVHIGDSTGVPLFDPAQVGGADLTATARYLDVGVEVVYPDNDGARSIVEKLDGQVNAYDVAKAVVDNTYDGCWVLMIGTNDAANIAAGSTVNAEQRIRSMLDLIGDNPVLWVDAVTTRTDDAYRNASMLAWNQELYRVAALYPNVRVFRWYDVVQPQWFRNDGIHYTIEGNAQRAALTAQALLEAFPTPPA